MKIFKSVIFSVILLITFLVLFSGLIISSFISCSLDIPEDTDCLFCGASQTEMGFIPEVIDKRLATKSFVVSTQAMPWTAKYDTLKNIIAENKNIKTIVLEISADSFLQDKPDEYSAEANVYNYYGKYLSFGFPFKYQFSLNRLEYVLNYNLKEGMISIINILTGRTDERVKEKKETRGFVPYTGIMSQMAREDIITTYKNEQLNISSYRDQSIALAEKIMQLCKKNNINVIVAVIPVSDTILWNRNGMDDFLMFLSDLTLENNCMIYDFNLYKDRFVLFQDDSTFLNENHLNKTGAEVFSALFADTMLRVRSGEDVSDLFYSSYEEMLEDSPYMEYYREHIG